MKSLTNIWLALLGGAFIGLPLNLFGEDLKTIDYRELGDKTVIIGRFGEMGLNHQFRAIVVHDNKKTRDSGSSVKLIEVDGKVQDPAHTLTVLGLPNEKPGTIIQFEAQEVGELVKIGLGSNPQRKAIDRVGCRSVLILKDASVKIVGFDDSPARSAPENDQDGNNNPFE